MVTDTAGFYLDGSPKEMGFFAREKPNPINWETFDADLDFSWRNDDKIEVLRAILFFHAGQKITHGKLAEFFTSKAIKLFEKDGYIKRTK